MEVGRVSRNQIFALLIIVEAALAVVYYMYYYVPQTARIVELKEEAQKKQRDVREIELTKKLLADTRLENERLKAEIEHLEKFFPEEMFVPTVLLQIEQLASATQLDITKIAPKTPTTGEKAGEEKAGKAPAGQQPAQQEEFAFDAQKEYTTSIVEFDAEGSYKALYDFMSELTSFPKLVVVNNFKVTTAGAAAGGQGQGKTPPEKAGMLKVTMPLTFYIQKRRAPVALQ
ncbi:MAG: hypothetical protein AB1742_04845 [bacterium]